MKPLYPTKSILLRLYDGEIRPGEQYVPTMQAYRKWVEEYCRQQAAFGAKLRALDPALQKEFMDIMDRQTDAEPYRLSEMFIDGFCLGARLMTEVYQKGCSDEI